MSVEPYTKELFQEWMFHPVTKRLMQMLLEDREMMKEGIIHNAFENEEEVKGRCRAIGKLLSIEYQDMIKSGEFKNENTEGAQLND